MDLIQAYCGVRLKFWAKLLLLLDRVVFFGKVIYPPHTAHQVIFFLFPFFSKTVSNSSLDIEFRLLRRILWVEPRNETIPDHTTYSGFCSLVLIVIDPLCVLHFLFVSIRASKALKPNDGLFFTHRKFICSFFPPEKRTKNLQCVLWRYARTRN